MSGKGMPSSARTGVCKTADVTSLERTSPNGLRSELRLVSPKSILAYVGSRTADAGTYFVKSPTFGRAHPSLAESGPNSVKASRIWSTCQIWPNQAQTLPQLNGLKQLSGPSALRERIALLPIFLGDSEGARNLDPMP